MIPRSRRMKTISLLGGIDLTLNPESLYGPTVDEVGGVLFLQLIQVSAS